MNPPLLRSPLLCLTLLALAACGGNGSEQGPAAPPQVGVIEVQPQDVVLSRERVGRLSPFRSADVRARVPGVLLKRSYEEGADVGKGQLLFQIDPAPLQAALDVNLAALSQAQATYTNAKVAAERARELAPKGYISAADLDNALAAERTAAAAVQMARANVQTARINLGYASVRSPIAGRAGQQQVTEGALVGNGSDTLLTTVEQIDTLYVNFTLSAATIEQMRRAERHGDLTLAALDKTTVRVSVPDGSAYAEPGVLDFSDTSVDPATGSINLRAQIPNPKHQLLPGMYVTLKVDLGQQHGVFVIPQPALLRDTDGAFVMTLGKDGKITRKAVAASDMQGNAWVVTAGLAAGDQVVVSGVQKVRDGDLAKASPWHPDDTGAPPATSAPDAAANGR